MSETAVIRGALNMLAMEGYDGSQRYVASRDALAALDALEARIAQLTRELADEQTRHGITFETLKASRRETREADARAAAAEHIIECAHTPLMRDVMRDRDEAVGRVAELTEALRAVLLEGTTNQRRPAPWTRMPERVEEIVRVALGGEQSSPGET